MADIKIAHKIINLKEKKRKINKNPIDENYESLKCDVITLDEESDEYQMINTYLQNTRDGRTMKLIDVFKVMRDKEDKRYNPKKLRNKMLLWHGSRFSNFVGILS